MAPPTGAGMALPTEASLALPTEANTAQCAPLSHVVVLVAALATNKVVLNLLLQLQVVALAVVVHPTHLFFFFFFGLQGRCSSSDGKAPTETPN